MHIRVISKGLGVNASAVTMTFVGAVCRWHADIHENQFRRVATIEAAGCYDALLVPVPAKDGIYYAEYFRPGRGRIFAASG